MRLKICYQLFLIILLGVTTVSCLNVNSENGDYHVIALEDVNDTYEFFSWTEDRIPMVSAHRGGRYYSGYAENTIEMFEYTIGHVPAIIEFDVRRSKDDVLVLMHDETTGRTATQDKAIRDLTFEEIRGLTLVDHEGNEVEGLIPTLEEVLEWGRGKTMFTVDVKSVNDLDETAQMILDVGAEAYATLITYSLDVAKEIHQKYPSLFLSVTVRNQDELERLLNSNINLDNVVAFTGTSSRDSSFNDTLHELGVYAILGTMGNIDNSALVKGDFVYGDLVKSGSDILSTDFPIEAHDALKNLIPVESTKSLFFRIDGK